MSRLTRSYGFASLFAVLCLGGSPLHAQVAPVRYWIPGGPFGLGGSTGSDTYGNFAGFDAAGRPNFQPGFFVGGEHGNLNWSGLNQVGASSNFSALSYDSTQFGYNYKTASGMPVTFFGGVDTVKFGNGIGSSLAPLTSTTAPGYGVHGGVEFKPTSNLSLSFGMGYSQRQSGATDSDINSNMLPGESPVFGGMRR